MMTNRSSIRTCKSIRKKGGRVSQNYSLSLRACIWLGANSKRQMVKVDVAAGQNDADFFAGEFFFFAVQRGVGYGT